MPEKGKHTARSVLKTYWGHDTFRGLQEVVINTIIDGKDCVAIMPTGGGKSICYQVPALLSEGICLVVSPLVALIKDQVAGLNRRGIKALELTGGLSFEETNRILDNCVYGGYKFLYLSPERLLQPLILNRLSQAKLSFVAIDEAHCISQWGHDFRPAYGKLATLKDLFPGIPTLALSATATANVLEDIQSKLNLSQPTIFKDSILRPNISYIVDYTEDKTYALSAHLKKVGGSVIIYVRSRNHAIDVARELNARGFSAAHYHGGMPTPDKDKQMTLWINDGAQIMVATSAFGMGIDKANVELIIHLDLPESLEAYYQESGRAGRDGQPSKAVILYHDFDKNRLTSFFVDQLPTIEFIKTIYRQLCSFLQIAYGESNDQLFQLDFISFCDHHRLAKNKVYQVLKILDQHSIISLRDNYKSEYKIKFNQSSQFVLNYLQDRPELAQIVLPILRNYTNCFEHLVSVDLSRIAHASNGTVAQVSSALERLYKQNIVAIERSDSDLSLLFIQPREDDKTINRIAKEVGMVLKGKIDRVNRVLKYVENNQTCKTVQLASYFGAKNTPNCGKCSVCMVPTDLKPKDLETAILETLSEGPKTSRELSEATGSASKLLTSSLKKLLKKDRIKVSLDNRYSL